jgi:two-component system, NarL family, response regulator LiaR
LKNIILYGVVLGLLILGLKYAEYKFILINNTFEIYAVIIAVLFTVLGVWVGLKFVKKEKVTVIKEVIITAPEEFEVNENNLKQLGISKREHEVLMLIAQGLSNQEVADKLFVSLNTVKTHSSKLFEKLNVQRRTQAVQEAKKLGLVP